MTEHVLFGVLRTKKYLRNLMKTFCFALLLEILQALDLICTEYIMEMPLYEEILRNSRNILEI